MRLTEAQIVDEIRAKDACLGKSGQSLVCKSDVDISFRGYLVAVREHHDDGRSAPGGQMNTLIFGVRF